MGRHQCGFCRLTGGPVGFRPGNAVRDEGEGAEDFRDELRLSYATAFVFIDMGAAHLEGAGEPCFCEWMPAAPERPQPSPRPPADLEISVRSRVKRRIGVQVSGFPRTRSDFGDSGG